MRWTVKLVTEAGPGQVAEEALLSLDRAEGLKIEDLGLTLAESRELLGAIQRSVVAAQTKAYAALDQYCASCGHLLRTKALQAHLCEMSG
jgi:hypothetical protein